MPSNYPVIKPLHMPLENGFSLVQFCRTALPSSRAVTAALAGDTSDKTLNIKTEYRARFSCTSPVGACGPMRFAVTTYDHSVRVQPVNWVFPRRLRWQK